jgi:hypothetical protein
MALTETKRQVWSDLKQVRARLDEVAAAAAQAAPPGAASAEQISLL